MLITISHQLSVTPPPGSQHAVLQLLLTPQSGPTQTVESWKVEMPGMGNAGRFTDAFGNAAHLVNQARPEGELTATVTGTVKTFDKHGVVGRIGGEPVPAIYKRVTALTKASASLHGKLSGVSRLDLLHALMGRVGETLGVLEGGQSQSQMSADGGQTQSQSQGATKTLPPAADYAHAFIGAARALDIPARYVTGYLADADGIPAFHAWAEAYDDALGWIGFDAMLGHCPTDRHVRLAVGLDAHSARPMRAVPAGGGIVDLGATVEAAEQA